MQVALTEKRYGCEHRKTSTKALFAVFVAAAAFFVIPSVVPAPAGAQGTACESRGNDPASCDRMFLEDLGRFGVPFTDAGNAIRVGHVAADYLAQHPNRAGLQKVVNEVYRDNAHVNMSAEAAVEFVKASVHYYGPPGLEERLAASVNAS